MQQTLPRVPAARPPSMKRSAAPYVVGAIGVGVLTLAVLSGGSRPAVAVRSAVAGALGRFFTLAELTASAAAVRLGVDNTPPLEAQENLRRLVFYVLDPLQAFLGRKVRVTSGFRTPAVNEVVGGSATSQHMSGEAADIMVSGLSAVELATAIIRLRLPFDQLIWYDLERGGHVHVSLTVRRANRGETLHAPAAGGYQRWAPGDMGGGNRSA